MTPAEPVLRGLWHATIVALLAAAFFLAFPQADLWVSGRFGDADGFALRHAVLPNVLPNVLRGAMIAATDGVVVLAAALLCLGALAPRLRPVRAGVLGFVVAAYALGAGLLVNGILKARSGRARPWNVDVFGGDARFTAVLHPADQCDGHCSFVSGEASALATVAALAILMAVPALPVRVRGPARAAIVAVAATGAALRVAFGAHFLSDVVFGAAFSVIAVLALYLGCGMHRVAAPAGRAAEAGRSRGRPPRQKITSRPRLTGGRRRVTGAARSVQAGPWAMDRRGGGGRRARGSTGIRDRRRRTRVAPGPCHATCGPPNCRSVSR